MPYNTLLPSFSDSRPHSYFCFYYLVILTIHSKFIHNPWYNTVTFYIYIYIYIYLCVWLYLIKVLCWALIFIRRLQSLRITFISESQWENVIRSSVGKRTVKLRLLLKIDTAIQEPEPGTGTVHNLCKLEHFAPQGIYMIIIYRGGRN
jgi:hypothetical protein